MTSGILETQIEISCKELRLTSLRQQFRALVREAIDIRCEIKEILQKILTQYF